MWVQSGFEPDAFWRQTPQTFQIIMRGVRKRMEGESRERTRQAWEIGVFSATAANGKLKPLRHYLRELPKPQTPQDMIAALRAHQASGAKMTITQIERK